MFYVRSMGSNLVGSNTSSENAGSAFGGRRFAVMRGVTRWRRAASGGRFFYKHFFSWVGRRREYHLTRTGSTNASLVQ
jgi:hypothetical protein